MAWLQNTTSLPSPFFNYPPSSGIPSCFGTTGTVMWHLHLTRPCCVALGQVLIWVVSPDWFEEHINIEHVYSGYSSMIFKKVDDFDSMLLSSLNSSSSKSYFCQYVVIDRWLEFTIKSWWSKTKLTGKIHNNGHWYFTILRTTLVDPKIDFYQFEACKLISNKYSVKYLDYIILDKNVFHCKDLHQINMHC